jgi:4-hydroxybenzoate polyprenyltransferase
MVDSPLQVRLRLWRIQTMALTGLVPVVGALVFASVEPAAAIVDISDIWIDLVLLFLVGSLLHVFGFVLNEWADVEIDRVSPDLQDKPLVSGSVSEREALFTALAAAALSFVPLTLVTTDVETHLVFLASVLMAGAYDLFGKRAPLDVLLAGCLTLLLLTGAMSLGHFDPSIEHHVTLFLCIGGLQFLQNLFQNAIEGGIKDADHDSAAGARTFAAVLGVKVENGMVETGYAFTNSAVIIKGIQIALLFYTALIVVEFREAEWYYLLTALLSVAAAVMVITLSMMLPPVEFDRSRLRRIFSIHELATYGAIILVITPLVGGTVALLLFVFPMLWFFTVNRTLFGGALEPGV